jgi:hypothetical protein
MSDLFCSVHIELDTLAVIGSDSSVVIELESLLVASFNTCLKIPKQQIELAGTFSQIARCLFGN